MELRFGKSLKRCWMKTRKVRQYSSTPLPCSLPGAATLFDLPTPERIAGYQVIEKLGEGGMGVVFKARQEIPNRLIALKMLKAYPTARQRERFELETELLGRLKHPGIAQIYDAGWTDETPQRPWFAMEFVDGLSLAKYANQNGLDRRARLDLLVQICEAIHHAHQIGIVHRDLKPANILVAENQQPKVLDFGIARVVESDLQMVTMNTHSGELIGTIPYMSPEQAAGKRDKIDIRSDVYSLGLVGYQLLCGELPYDVIDCPVVEAIRTIRETPPTPLSKHDRECAGDLDTIFLSALEKNPAQRYVSAWQFKEDIERHLRSEPITARPTSTRYKFKKFVRRNQLAVAAGIIVAIALFAGGTVASYQWLRAENALVNQKLATKTAEDEAEKANLVSDYLIEMVMSASPHDQGTELKVIDTVDQSVANIEKQFADRPDLAALAHQTMGRFYRHLSKLEQSEEQLRQAYQIKSRIYDEQHPELMEAEFFLALVLKDLGRLDESEALLRTTLRKHKESYGIEDESTLEVLNHLALTWMQAGKLNEALSATQQVVEVSSELLGEEHRLTRGARSNVGLLLTQLKRYDEAESELRQTLEILKTTTGSDSSETVNAMQTLASVLLMQGKPGESQQMFEQVCSATEKRFGPNHADTLNVMRNMAFISMNLKDFGDAEKQIREVMRRAEKTYPSGHWFIAQLKGDLGLCLCETNEIEQGVELLTESARELEQSLGAQNNRTISVKAQLDKFSD